MLSSRQGFPRRQASLFWLAALRGAGGALGCFRFHANLVALRVLPTLQNGVSVLGSRWGGQPVFRSLCARSPGCSCFCLRLDFQVTVSVRGSQGPGFLVLAFSARTLKSSGVPARRVPAGGFCVGMLPLVCSTPACRRAFSCGPPLLLFGVLLSSEDLLVVKLSPLCWLPAVRGAEGSWQLQEIWLPFVFCRCFRTGCQS